MNQNLAVSSSPNLNTFPKLLDDLVSRVGEDSAIREKDLGIWQSWTWREFQEEARIIANSLAENGFSRGDKLAVIGDNRPELYFGIMATQMLGGVPVALGLHFLGGHKSSIFALSELRPAPSCRSRGGGVVSRIR